MIECGNCGSKSLVLTKGRIFDAGCTNCGDSWIFDADSIEAILFNLVYAIESKWKKTTPPKELIEPLRKARALLE